MRRDLVKGDLPALILAVLGTGARHGYAIAREVERLSDDALRMKEGTLYPALRVLEQDGLVAGAWEAQERGANRKVYTLTEKGVKEGARRTQELRAYASLIQSLLGKLEPGRTGHMEAGHAQIA